MAELWVAKTTALLILLVVSMLFGLLPFKLIRFLSNRSSNTGSAELVISLLNCCAGGVFIATSFLHLLPEVNEGLDEIWTAQFSRDLTFPLGNMIVVFGFFIIMGIEQGILACYGEKYGSTKNKNRRRSSIKHRNTDANGVHPDTYGATAKTEIQPLLSQPTDISEEFQPSKYCTGYLKCNDMHAAKDVDNIEYVITEKSSSERKAISEYDGIDGEVLGPENAHTGNETPTELSSLLLLLALSIHTIFEGLALGLLQTEPQVWELFIALAIHKTIVAFSLGLHIAKHVTHLFRGVVFIIAFSFICPLGGIIGVLITEGTGSNMAVDISSCVLQGIATGTFLHVAFFEILHKETEGGQGLAKVAAAFFGFILLAIMFYFLPS